MDEQQANEIIGKLDYLYINAPTKAQADEIICRLKDLAIQVSELTAVVEKFDFPGA